MNPNEPRHPWSRLVAAARRADDAGETTAPYGFATRVVALAFSAERRVSLFDRFALRALGVACLLAIASVAVNYSAMNRSTPAEDPIAVTAEDPMSVLLDV